MTIPSTKPYLIRAIHEWCLDSGFRPYVAVVVDARTLVPLEFVRNGEIVLNISADATSRLRLGNDLIEFEARFGGVARSISVPVDNVSAIYAAENGQGMAFEVTPVSDEAAAQPLSEAEHVAPALAVVQEPSGPSEEPGPGAPDPDRPGGRARLKRIK